MAIWTRAFRGFPTDGPLTMQRTLWPNGDTPHCLSCDEPMDMERPFVFWVGKITIALHSECAKRLGMHLLGDAREVDLMTNVLPHRSAGLMAELLPNMARKRERD